MDGVFCYIYFMKNLCILLTFATISIANCQNDTLLYVGFDSLATDAQQNIVAIPTNNLDLSGWGNLTWLGSEIKTELKDVSSNWFENDLWKKWHKTPYIEKIDTIIGITTDTTIYDTTINVGLRSFSWFEDEDRALSVLLSPPVWISKDNAKLNWKSMPIQGPRYQDGYKVYILNGNSNKITSTDPSSHTPSFIMKEMNNSIITPSDKDSSLFKIYEQNGFIPQLGVMHKKYTLPAPSNTGLIDSSRQHPFMQEFEIDLANYSGYIQILFFHDSNDDNGIIIDDILITGTEISGTKNISKKQIVSYPNPASKTITFDIKEVTNYKKIQVYSILGELVLIKENSFSNKGKISIDINHLNSGIYQVEITSDTNKYFGKFSKK